MLLIGNVEMFWSPRFPRRSQLCFDCSKTSHQYVMLVRREAEAPIDLVATFHDSGPEQWVLLIEVLKFDVRILLNFSDGFGH